MAKCPTIVIEDFRLTCVGAVSAGLLFAVAWVRSQYGATEYLSLAPAAMVVAVSSLAMLAIFHGLRTHGLLSSRAKAAIIVGTGVGVLMSAAQMAVRGTGQDTVSPGLILLGTYVASVSLPIFILVRSWRVSGCSAKEIDQGRVGDRLLQWVKRIPIAVATITTLLIFTSPGETEDAAQAGAVALFNIVLFELLVVRYAFAAPSARREIQQRGERP